MFQFHSTEAGQKLGLPVTGSLLTTADEAMSEAITLLEEGNRFQNDSPLLSEGEVWGRSGQGEPFCGGVVGTYHDKIYATSEGRDEAGFQTDLAVIREVV